MAASLLLSGYYCILTAYKHPCANVKMTLLRVLGQVVIILTLFIFLLLDLDPELVAYQEIIGIALILANVPILSMVCYIMTTDVQTAYSEIHAKTELRAQSKKSFPIL